MLENINNEYFKYFLRLLKEYDIFNLTEIKNMIKSKKTLLSYTDYINYIYILLENSKYSYVIDIIWLNHYIKLYHVPESNIESYCLYDIQMLSFYLEDDKYINVKTILKSSDLALKIILNDKDFTKQLITILKKI